MKQPTSGWTPATGLLFYGGSAILWAYLLIGMVQLDMTGVFGSYVQLSFWADFFNGFGSMLHQIALAFVGLY